MRKCSKCMNDFFFELGAFKNALQHRSAFESRIVIVFFVISRGIIYCKKIKVLRCFQNIYFGTIKTFLNHQKIYTGVIEMFFLKAKRFSFMMHINCTSHWDFFLELKNRCDVQTSTHLYTETATTKTAQTHEIYTTATTQKTLS